MDQNPYLPPSADINDGLAARLNADEPPVHPGFRLLAALLDWFLFLSFMLLGAVLSKTGYTYNHTLGSLVAFVMMATRSTFGWVLLLGWVGVNGLQAYKIATTGQSLGKRVLRMKIVRQDGEPVGFVRGVLLRSWLVYLVTLIMPFGLGSILYLADALFIIRADRRCVHDLIAGSRVRDLYASEESETAR